MGCALVLKAEEWLGSTHVGEGFGVQWLQKVGQNEKESCGGGKATLQTCVWAGSVSVLLLSMLLPHGGL